MTSFLFRFPSQQRPPKSVFAPRPQNQTPQLGERTSGGGRRSLVDPHHVGLKLALSRASSEEGREGGSELPANCRPSSSSQTDGALHHRFFSKDRQFLRKVGTPTARCQVSRARHVGAVGASTPASRKRRRIRAADLAEGIAKQWLTDPHRCLLDETEWPVAMSLCHAAPLPCTTRV